MDFDVEKLLAKVSGENVENFAACVMSDADKRQIDFAFEEMFNGLSLTEWMRGGLLVDAWNVALDKMRDFIFNLNEKNYVTDYQRIAVFDFRKHKSKNFHNSVHACEYFQTGTNSDILEKAAREKIQNSVDIIKNLVSVPKTCTVKQKASQNIYEFHKEREAENERTRK